MAAASTHLPLFALSHPRKSRSPISLALIPQRTSSSAANNSEGPLISIQRKNARGACLAVAESLDVSRLSEDEESILYPNDAPSEEPKKEEAQYDWREEWYPLYLTKNIPDDAPLALTVFHKQLVLYRDGQGVVRCYEDRCPHRLAKLSEGQLVDGRLECLYHGWQFEGDGHCVKIPQLPEGAKIPRSACAKAYDVKDSQGVVWVWMSEKSDPDESKLPWFEHFARPGFKDASTIHELPYDHSILLENLMDPAHVPISHDRTDWQSKREDAQPLVFQLLERSDRGFAGYWWRSRNPAMKSLVRFQAPCVIQSNREVVDKKGGTRYFSALFLCRPAGQGKTMVIVRFGSTKRSWLFDVFPEWFIHRNANTILEQDMGFLSSQNEILVKEKVPTKELYLNLRSSDVWVLEYRRWLDKVGHGMPYYFGHSTISLPNEPAVVEHAPAGLVAAISASFPAKGGVGTVHAPNFMNRYYRHVVHCKECSGAVKRFEIWARAMVIVGLACAASAIMASSGRWKGVAVAAAAMCAVGYYVCVGLRGFVMDNVLRKHRRL